MVYFLCELVPKKEGIMFTQNDINTISKLRHRLVRVRLIGTSQLSTTTALSTSAECHLLRNTLITLLRVKTFVFTVEIGLTENISRRTIRESPG